MPISPDDLEFDRKKEQINMTSGKNTLRILIKQNPRKTLRTKKRLIKQYQR